MSPGPALAEVLEGLDQSRVAGIDLSTLLQAWDRQLSWTTARWLDTIVELGLALPGPDDTPRRATLLPLFAETEVRSALVCSKQVASARQNEGAALRWSLPAVGAALAAGDLDLARVRVCLHETADVDPDVAVAAVTEVLPEARTLTPGELAARLRELVCALDPDAAADRYDAGVASRRLAGLRNRDGTVDLCGQNLPVDRAAAAMARVDTLVVAAKSAGHPGMLRVTKRDHDVFGEPLTHARTPTAHPTPHGPEPPF